MSEMLSYNLPLDRLLGHISDVKLAKESLPPD